MGLQGDPVGGGRTVEGQVEAGPPNRLLALSVVPVGADDGVDDQVHVVVGAPSPPDPLGQVGPGDLVEEPSGTERVNEYPVGDRTGQPGHHRAKGGQPDRRGTPRVRLRHEHRRHQGEGVKLAPVVKGRSVGPAGVDGPDRLDHLPHLGDRPVPEGRIAFRDVRSDLATQA